MSPNAPDDPPPGPGIPLTLAEDRARRVSAIFATTCVSRARERRRPPSRAGRDHGFTLADASRPLALDFAPRRQREHAATRRQRRSSLTRTPDHLVIPAAGLREGAQRDRDRLRRRRRVAQPQPGVPLHAVRAGARPPRVSLLRSAGPQGALDAQRSTSPRRGTRSPTARRSRPARRTAGGRSSVRRNRSRCRPTCSRSPPAGSRSKPPSAPAARSGCSIARPMPPRWRATATRSSICTPRRSPGSSATPASRIPGASSISCSCRRSSSAGWSTPARSSTTPRRCCSIRRRRRTRSSAAPASSRTRPRTCGSAIS